MHSLENKPGLMLINQHKCSQHVTVTAIGSLSRFCGRKCARNKVAAQSPLPASKGSCKTCFQAH
eukprot:383296-Amphidinium_carterae.1